MLNAGFRLYFLIIPIANERKICIKICLISKYYTLMDRLWIKIIVF